MSTTLIVKWNDALLREEPVMTPWVDISERTVRPTATLVHLPKQASDWNDIKVVH